MARKKELKEPSLIRSVYMPQSVWIRVDNAVLVGDYRSRNEFLEKLITAHLDQNKK